MSYQKQEHQILQSAVEQPFREGSNLVLARLLYVFHILLHNHFLFLCISNATFCATNHPYLRYMCKSVVLQENMTFQALFTPNPLIWRSPLLNWQWSRHFQIPTWGLSRWCSHRDDRNAYITFPIRSLNGKVMMETQSLRRVGNMMTSRIAMCTPISEDKSLTGLTI